MVLFVHRGLRLTYLLLQDNHPWLILEKQPCDIQYPG